MHISASLQWLMKFSRKTWMTKTAMLKKKNTFFVWATRLGLVWCGLSLMLLKKVKTFFPMPAESACWEHICKPLDWNVAPSEPASCKEFIGLKQTEPECSLPRFYLLRQKCSLQKSAEKVFWKSLFLSFVDHGTRCSNRMPTIRSPK